MNKKTHIMNLVMSILIFAVGRFMIGLNLGKLGIVGFTGYVLCAFAAIIVICTMAVIIVLKNEEKKNEK